MLDFSARFCKFCFISWVHTGLFKCSWSAFEVHLRLTCVWTVPFSLDWSWLVVLSCHRNFKASKCPSALSSKVKTRLWDCIYPIKASEVYYQSVNRLEPQISLSQASKRELIDEWGYWSPRNVGRFFSVPLHELVQKFHDFIFSLYLTAETTLMEDLAVETKWPMFHNRAIFLFCGFLNAVYSFFNSFKPLFRVHLQQEQWSFTTWVNLTSVVEEGPVRPFPCAGISLTYAGVH